MTKVEQIGTLDDLNKIKRVELHDLFFNQCKSDRYIAKMYGTTKKEVKRRRKELGLGWYMCGFRYVMGGEQYRGKVVRKNE